MIIKIFNSFRHLPRSHSHTEALIASIGAFSGIAIIYFIMMELALPANSFALLAASSGATALLLFSMPASEFSRPWAVLCGHGVSSLVGVTCFQLLDNQFLSSALSVSLAIFLMHTLKCLHPPGGATALLAVIGGENITNLGYGYVLFPILSNVLALVLIASVFNYFLIPILKAGLSKIVPDEEDICL